MKYFILLSLLFFIAGCSKQRQPIFINNQDENKPIYILKSDSTYEIYNSKTNELILEFNKNNTDSLSLSTIKYISDVENEQQINDKSNLDSIYVSIFTDIANKLDKNKLWLFSYDTIFTVFATLFVFITGLLIQYFFVKRKYYKDNYDYLINILSNAINYINIELNMLGNLIDSIKNENIDLYYGIGSDLINFESYYSLKRDDLYKSYLIYGIGKSKKNRKLHFLMLSQSIFTINAIKNDIRSFYNEFTRRNDVFLNDYKTYKEKVVEARNNIRELTLKKDKTKDKQLFEFFDRIDKVFKDSIKGDPKNKDSIIFNNNTINIPLRTLINDHYANIPESKELFHYANNGAVCFVLISNLKEWYTKELEGIKDIITKQKEILMKAIPESDFIVDENYYKNDKKNDSVVGNENVDLTKEVNN